MKAENERQNSYTPPCNNLSTKIYKNITYFLSFDFLRMKAPYLPQAYLLSAIVSAATLAKAKHPKSVRGVRSFHPILFFRACLAQGTAQSAGNTV